MFDSATSTSPSGSTPTARAAASAASAFARMCLEAKGSVSVSGSGSTSPPGAKRAGVQAARAQRLDVAARAERDGRDVVAPVGLEQRLVGRQDRGAAGLQGGDQLGL